MGKFVLILTALLMTSTVYSTFAKASVDTKSMAKTILNIHQSHAPQKGSFAIVYGGQDISRGSISLMPARINQAVMLA